MDHEFERLRRTIEAMDASREMRRVIESLDLSASIRDSVMRPAVEVQEAAKRIGELYGGEALERLAVRAVAPPIPPDLDLRVQQIMGASIGYGLTEALESAVRTMQTTDAEMLRSIEALCKPPAFIGHFDIPVGDEVEADDAEPDERAADRPESLPRVGIPEEVKGRLIQVEYLPLRVIERIRREPRLMHHGLTPREFEELVAELLCGLGFDDVKLTPASGDGGRDVIAVQRVAGIPVLFNMECKRFAESRRIGPDTMRALLGTVTARATRSSMGVLVTTSSFTDGARKLLVAEPQLGGRDFDDLVEWVAEYLRRRKGEAH